MASLVPTLTRAGLHLPRLGLWLDALKGQRGSERVFVSHAHSDHIAPHREVICTEATAGLMHARGRGPRAAHKPGHGAPLEFSDGSEPFRVTLLPAGHIFGSAMAFIEAERGALLYTGDFKLRRGLSCEACEPRRADVLVMETTFGTPRHRMPAADQVWADLVGFCRDALAAGGIPVLQAYALGKCQELLLGLAAAGFRVALHREAWAMTRTCAALGLAVPPHVKLGSCDVAGHVVLIPPTAKLPGDVRPARTAVVTGWAVESSCQYRAGVDAAFPLSDHADFGELLEMVERVQPRRICTVHGFAREFAATLRERGLDARALGQQEQLGLPFVEEAPSSRAPTARPAP